MAICTICKNKTTLKGFEKRNDRCPPCHSLFKSLSKTLENITPINIRKGV